MARTAQQCFYGMAAMEPRKACQSGIPKKQKRDDEEHREQSALFTFIRLWAKRIPLLSWVFAIPNGAFFGYGNEGDIIASKMVAEGLTSGVWDVFMPWPVTISNGSSVPGLWIEMKIGDNDLTPNQATFRAEMERRGYRCVVCYSWIEAAKAIGEYANITNAAFWRAIEGGN